MLPLIAEHRQCDIRLKRTVRNSVNGHTGRQIDCDFFCIRFFRKSERFFYVFGQCSRKADTENCIDNNIGVQNSLGAFRFIPAVYKNGQIL